MTQPWSPHDEERLVKRLRRSRQPGFELAVAVQSMLDTGAEDGLGCASRLLERYGSMTSPQFKFEYAAPYHLGRVRGLVCERRCDWVGAAVAYRDGALAQRPGSGDLPLLMARVVLSRTLTAHLVEASALLARELGVRTDGLPMVQFEHHLLAMRLLVAQSRWAEAREHGIRALEWVSRGGAGPRANERQFGVPPLDLATQREIALVVDGDGRH